MKRSLINRVIREAEELMAKHSFLLPPFGKYSVADWKNCDKAACKEIFDLGLGWDVTSFGKEDFFNIGLLLFTIRNGKFGSSVYPKPYAEKIMVVRENQVTLCHFHWNKQEDIINRGGGNLVIELTAADPANNALKGGKVEVTIDGQKRVVDSGDKVILTPGESITLLPCHAHSFWAEKGSGTVLAGEVSMVNDDMTDNCFVLEKEALRYDPVEEDEDPYRLLCSEYSKWI